MRFFVRSAMRALYPRSERLPGIEDTELDAFLDRVAREADALMKLGLALGTLVFTITPILTVGWPLPSFLLPLAVRQRHADRIVSTRLYLLRQAVFVLKMMAGLCWGQHASVRRAMALEPYPDDPATWRAADADPGRAP